MYSAVILLAASTLRRLCDGACQPSPARVSFYAAQEPTTSSPLTAGKKKRLQEGTCFKAAWVSCNRTSGEAVEVMAEEIHIVIDSSANCSVAPQRLQVLTRGPNRKRVSHETRRIMTSSSFRVATPSVYLRSHKTENGTPIVDIENGSLATAWFPPMALTPDVGYRETNAAAVIFGLDPSVGQPWVSPVAMRHMQRVWDDVTNAGGIFIADFDTSTGGWARFRTVYICPAPSNTVYVHTCRVQPKSFEFCGKSHVIPPLLFAGGKRFKQGFKASNTGLADPEIFAKLDLSTVS